MAIAIEQEVTNTSWSATTSAATGTLGATPTSGNLLLLVQFCNDNPSGRTFTPPSGWTQRRAFNDNESSCAVFWKIAGGSEPTSYTVTWTGDSFVIANYLVELSGVDGSTPFDADDGAFTDHGFVSGPDNHPSLTTITAAALHAIIGSNPVSAGWTEPGGTYSERADVRGLAVYTKEIASAGATGAVSLTHPFWYTVSYGFALRPAGGGGGSPQTVEPSGIASGEAFGTAALSVGAVTVSPSGIASSNAFGTAALSTGGVTVSPSGIASTEAFGTAQVNLTLAPTGIASTEAFGTAVVTPGAVSIAPSGIGSGETFGTAALAVGAVTVSPTGIASTEAFGTVTVSGGATVITAQGIASAEAFGTPAVAPGAVTVSPAGLASVEAFGTAALGLVLTAQGIAAGNAFGTPVLTPGAVTVAPSGIASAAAFGLSTVTGGDVDDSPAHTVILTLTDAHPVAIGLADRVGVALTLE